MSLSRREWDKSPNGHGRIEIAILLLESTSFLVFVECILNAGLLCSMVIMVIALNIALAVLCLGVAWKLHQFKRWLQRTTRWLIDAEQDTDFALRSAPDYILLGQFGAQYGKKQMTGLGTIQQQFVRWAALIQMVAWMSQRQTQPFPRRFLPKIKRR
jgi:hypothetical protein